MAEPTKTQMAKQEAEWQAETDAPSLAQAMAVHKDKTRLKAAKAGAKRLLKFTKERLDEMKDDLAGLKAVASDKKFFDYDEDGA